jgi:hypothetical protein
MACGTQVSAAARWFPHNDVAWRSRVANRVLPPPILRRSDPRGEAPSGSVRRIAPPRVGDSSGRHTALQAGSAATARSRCHAPSAAFARVATISCSAAVRSSRRRRVVRATGCGPTHPARPAGRTLATQTAELPTRVASATPSSVSGPRDIATSRSCLKPEPSPQKGKPCATQLARTSAVSPAPYTCRCACSAPRL